jgi:hypothetical protein
VSLRPAHLCTDTIHCVLPCTPNTPAFAGQDTIYRVPTTGASLYGHNTLCPSLHSKHPRFCRPGHDSSCPYNQPIPRFAGQDTIVRVPTTGASLYGHNTLCPSLHSKHPRFCRPGHDISCPYDRPIPRFAGQDTIHRVPTTGRSPALQARTRYIVSLRLAHLCTDTIHCVLPCTPNTPAFAGQDTIIRVRTTSRSPALQARTRYIVSLQPADPPLCRPGHDISCPYDRRISVRTQYIVSFPALQRPPLLQARTR